MKVPEIRAPAPVIDEHYVSPRLARMLGARVPNSNARPPATLQQSPPPGSTQVSAQRPTAPPMRVSPATSRSPNGAQVPDVPKSTSASQSFRTTCESEARETPPFQGLSTLSPAPKQIMQDRRAHETPAASVSAAALIDSVSQSQAVIGPQHLASIIFTYARELISESRAHSPPEQRTSTPAGHQPDRDSQEHHPFGETSADATACKNF